MAPATPHRWSPDAHLVAAVLAGSPKRWADLGEGDRAWLTAGLNLAGLTAQDIADRLGCCLRSVRAQLAADVTQLAKLYQIETAAFSDEIRLARSEAAQQGYHAQVMQRELERTRAQRDRLIARRAGVFAGCGHTKEKYNVYVVRSTGYEQCRQCHATRQRERRLAARSAGTPAG